MKKTVIFSCVTSYNVFVSFILTKMKYQDCHTILLITDKYQHLYDRAIQLKIWDEVIIIRQKYASFQSIFAQVDKILSSQKIHILHYYSWGNFCSRYLFDAVDSTVEIILTDEGIASYDALNSYKLLPDKINKIKELWLFEPELNISSFDIKIRSIDFISYLNKKENFNDFKIQLNKLFDYKEDVFDNKFIFFDQPLSSGKLIEYNQEKYFLKNLKNIFKNLNSINNVFSFVIKPHPGEYFPFKYDGLNFQLTKQNAIPWEVIYFNNVFSKNDFQKNVYLTIKSSAVLNTYILFKDVIKDNHLVFLHKILQNKFVLNVDDKIINRFIEVYGSQKVYIPENFLQLRQILSDIFEVSLDTNNLETESNKTENFCEIIGWLKYYGYSSIRTIKGCLRKYI